MEITRRKDLDRLYRLLDELRQHVGGYRYLRDCQGRMNWPMRGVYFFFEPDETREDGQTPRVVRVGTHAVSIGSRTTLWNRLSQHRGMLGGEFAGGGNHRGSIFRLHVGTALLQSRSSMFEAAGETWGKGNRADRMTKQAELHLEQEVSRYIGAMPFLWVSDDDAASPTSERHIIEANIIELLSNAGKPSIDAPSRDWLGHHADRQPIRESGLWNVDFVYGSYDPIGLDVLQRHIQDT